MTNNFIEFKKKRELGDILTDTFAFLRQNGKHLLSILVKTCGIAFVLFLGALAYYLISFGDILKPGNLGNPNLFDTGSMIISFIVLIISGLFLYGLFFGTILHFIKEYINNHGVVDEEKVRAGTRKDFGSLIGLGFLSGIIIFLGFIFCIIPGVYFYVPLSLVFSIMIFGNKGISDSISESFTLVKGEWWMTFATLFVVGLLVGVIGFIFSIPALIYQFTSGFISASQGSMADPSAMFDWVYVLLNVLSNAAQFITYIITAVATAFIYFHLNEKKNLTGTFEKIDSLGKSE